LAVEIPDMATLRRVGATSVQYKKFAPRNPIGMKKLNKNTKSADAICAAALDLGNEDATARASMQLAIPAPLNMKSLRRPKRSMVKKATKHEKNFQVRAPPERMREVSASSPRPCWKMIYSLC
jgi:hypothetical protein